MADLKKIIEKIFYKVDPRLKINHKEKVFYMSKSNVLANFIRGYYIIIKGYTPKHYPEDLKSDSEILF